MDKIQLYPEDAHLIHHVLINPSVPRLVGCVTPKTSFEKAQRFTLEGVSMLKSGILAQKKSKGIFHDGLQQKKPSTLAATGLDSSYWESLGTTCLAKIFQSISGRQSISGNGAK